MGGATGMALEGKVAARSGATAAAMRASRPPWNLAAVSRSLLGSPSPEMLLSP
jgi:hypothetical protein